MVAAIVAGIIYLVTMGEFLGPYMRSSGVWWLLASFILSLGALHFFFRRRFWIAGMMLAISLAGMVINRHIVRLVFLEGQFDPAAATIASQWSVFAVFAVCLILALAAVIVMLRLYFGSRTAPGRPH
jgi:hypothetical protein